jgi:hypothetical protein
MPKFILNPFTNNLDAVDEAGPTGVTSAATLTDNSIIRGDGGARGVQDSGVLIDDSDNITAIESITLNLGTNINEFSTDGTLGGDSDNAVPTEKAVKTYVDASVFTLPLTTKGDILTRDSSSNIRLGIGANGQVLTADSGETSGVKWSTVAGTGDVVGPAGATDNAACRYDTATGKLIQDSGVIIDDADNITGVTSLASGSLTLTTDLAVAHGGTGASTLTDHGVLFGSGAGAITASAALTNGQLVIGNTGSDPSIATLTDGANITITEGAGTITIAAAGGTPPTLEVLFDASELQALETNFAPLEKLSGANVKTFVRAFANAGAEQEEYANGKFQVPGDVSTVGADSVTFRAYVMAKTAVAAKNVQLTFGWVARNDSEDFDVAYTDEDSGDKAIDATQDDLTEITWTETLTNLAWAANDLVYFRLSRPAATANDLAGDMYMHSFCIEIPRE